ncbi:uncharacterized protein N0V89_005115 [Didymosphaeria variabile]|uniref:F-box domain-containing protein n=1 Tax=Didymosphaeria variabile TaxID=1932322 RepID=A0A9W8XKG7_9PLEO|nr:uncharacterized protein N0V89_005115 [Didymosphaeria variabile]KAJ4353386.1 hypothetical protein N0V89_005115 [Didymosphaeria variabile]
MEKLPQELVDQISSHLDVVQLKQTLTLNQKFQAAAEQYSGAFEEAGINEENAQKFLDTFSSHRFRYLRRISFTTTLPAPQRDPDAGRSPCRESLEDLKALDEEFTRQIRLLFAVIRKLEVRVQGLCPGNVELTIYTPFMDVDPNLFFRHRAFVSWRIHLLAPQNLPVLGSIRSLRFVNGTPFSPFKEPWRTLRKLDLRVIVDIANKLPNLNVLGCEIGGDEWPTPLRDEVTARLWRVYQGPRRDSRHDFAAALNEIALPALREVQLNFISPSSHVEMLPHYEKMPNLTAPASHDPFSSSIRILSYGLRRMCIFAVVDSTLFIPSDGSTPSWPHLESLNIKFHMASPEGSYYFLGPGGGLRSRRSSGYELQPQEAYPPLEQTAEDREDDMNVDYVDWVYTSSAQYRILPDDDTLGPFLAAFAESTKYMPRLKEAALWCPLRYSVDDMMSTYDSEDDETELVDECIPDMAWGIAYTAPGEKAFDDHPGVDRAASRQLWWKVGKCRPSPRVSALVRQVGRHQHDDNLIEYWNDIFYGDTLVDRNIFEAWAWRVFQRDVEPDNFQRDVKLNNFQGEVEIDNFQGNVEFDNFQRDVKLDNFQRDVKLDNFQRDVESDNFPRDVELGNFQKDVEDDNFQRDVIISRPKGLYNFQRDVDPQLPEGR